jgi:serine/threonine protein kinase
MPSADWDRVKQIFHEVIQKTEPERERLLEVLCGEDSELRSNVETLLAAYGDAGEFMESLTFEGGDAAAAAAAGLAAADPPEGPGTRIGDFKLLQLIGEGGFGAVYMAEQERPIRRRVALKIIKPGMDSKEVIARFEAERQALAMLNHPNIASVYDAGMTDTGRPYFVMELVRGLPITDFCDDNRLSTRERLHLFRDVCNAIHHAHQTGIIHRDIKPSNVLVTMHAGEPVPKVIDFGVAKATHHRLTEKTLFTDFSHFVGTPTYMSPEQAELGALEIDERSDVYSLGVLLYELLTGSTPLDGTALRRVAYFEMLRILREEEPPKPSTRLSTLGEAANMVARNRGADAGALSKLLRGDLDWIAMKALEKKRSRRYETAADLADDIDRYFYRDPIRARPPSVAYRLQKFAAKRRVPLGSAAAILTAFIVAGTYTAWQTGSVSARLAEADASSGHGFPSRRLIGDAASLRFGSTSPTTARVTGDGRHLLRYAEERRGFELIDIDTHEVRELTSEGPDPVQASVTRWLLSPDERNIAATVESPSERRDDPGAVELRLFEVGGEGTGRLVYSWDSSSLALGSVRPFGWAADDPRIFLWLMRRDRSAEVASLNLESGDFQVLKTIPWRSLTQQPSLSPDGSFVAYHDADEPNGPNDLFILASDGSHEVRLDDPADDSRPMFAPDGTGVVFLSDRRDGVRDLWFQPLTEGRPTADPRIVFRDVAPFGTARRFASNGSLFYYFAQTRWEVYEADLDAAEGVVGAPRLVAPRAGEMNEGPAFTPRADILGHLRDRGRRLVVRDLGSGAEREIPLAASMLAPSMSWCVGGETAFVTGFQGGTGVAYRVDVQRGLAEPLPLVEPSKILCLDDGDDIVYLQGVAFAGRGQRIIRRSLGTGLEETLYEGDLHLESRSLDGSLIVFDERDGEESRLMILSAAGGAARPIASAPLVRGYGRAWSPLAGAVWEPQGESLLIIRRDANAGPDEMAPEVTLSRLEPDTGLETEVGRFRLPGAEGGFFGARSYTLSADGSRLAFQRHLGLAAEVWAIDGLLDFIQSGERAPPTPGSREVP